MSSKLDLFEFSGGSSAHLCTPLQLTKGAEILEIFIMYYVIYMV